MKAYLFIETGEVRVAKEGEWYTNCYGEIYRVEGTITSGERNVVIRHEIELPEGAEGFEYRCSKGCVTESGYIPIPRPKVKVKKWTYEFVCKGVTWRSTTPLSQAEYNEQPMSGHKIPETEIEVEE